MNNAVQQVSAEITATAAKPSGARKEKAADDAQFMNMLSNAMNGKQNETVKQPEQANKSTDLANSSEQPATQANPDEKPSALDLEDSVAYEQQAVAAAMQMQVLPIMAELPQVEITEESIAADEPIAIQPIQAEQINTATTESHEPETVQSTSSNTVKAEQTVTEQPQGTKAAAATESAQSIAETKPAETTAQTARTEEAAPDTKTTQAEPQIQTDTAVRQSGQRNTIRQRPEADAKSTEVETVTDGEGEAQIIKQPETPRPIHQMRNHRDPEAAQTKFDGMIARASRELNQNTAVQETQSTEDITEEAPITEKQAVPVAAEAKPQETAKQPELTKTETKPQEEAKPTEQVTVPKSVKAPATEQRPQQQISKNDEALLGITQTKQPEITHEVIRSAPEPQQAQPVQVPDQAEQIKAQVIQNMEKERTEFQMQLQPEELGKVNVKMILEGGKLSVEIAAINPKSAEMLSRQVESLAASLKASGADVSSINVVTANENVSAQMDSEYNLNNFRNQEQGQGQNGHSNKTGTAGEQDENAAQAEREPSNAPQRILNYSV